MGAFGEKLRKQREQRGLALDAISNTTKISTRMLRALEDEHFDQLPGGVFNKGFVRAYARQVGLDEEETVTDYLAALRESQVQSQQILPDFRTPAGKLRSAAPPVTPQDARHHILPASDHPGGSGLNKASNDFAATDRRKQDRRSRDRSGQDHKGNYQGGEAVSLDEPRRRDAALAAQNRQNNGERDSRKKAPLPASAAEGVRKEERQHDSPSMSGFITLGAGADISAETAEPADAVSPRVSRITVAAAILAITIGLALWTSYRRRGLAPTAVSPSISSAPSAQAPAPVTTSAPASSPKIDTASAASKPAVAKSPAASAPASAKASAATTVVSKPSPAPEPATRSAAKIAPPSAAPPLSTFILLIRAEQTTWVSIIADGKPVIHETLIAPAHTSVRASHDVTVRVGNAAGVSFLLNGKEFPGEGNTGEPKTYAFDSTGPKAMPQASAQAPVR